MGYGALLVSVKPNVLSFKYLNFTKYCGVNKEWKSDYSDARRLYINNRYYVAKTDQCKLKITVDPLLAVSVKLIY